MEPTQEKKTQAEAQPDAPIMRTFKGDKNSSPNKMKYIVVFLVVILIGLGSGYALASKNSSSTGSDGKTSLLGLSKGQIMGTKSADGLDGPAEGVIKEGGIEGEGAYHMDREGGESQTVYLTSSSVDMQKVLNKKVKVWGKTQDAEHAGWLLDVSRLEVL